MAKCNQFRLSTFITAMLLFVAVGIGLVGCKTGDDRFQPTLTPTSTIAPANTELSLPDLVIQSVTVHGDPTIICPSPEQTYEVQILVKNQGDQPAGSFVVRLNLDRQLINTVLQPGESVEVVFPGFSPDSKVMVDATALVVESNENNNQFAHQIELPTPSAKCAATPTPEIPVLEAKAVLEGHNAKVWDVEFSPDGRFVASGSIDDTLRLWSIELARLIRTMQGHPFPILQLEFTPNGKNIVTGSTDGILRVWDVLTGQLIEALEGHTGWVTGLDISRDGKWVVSSAEDETVRLWRLPNGTPTQLIDEGMSGVREVRFSPDSLSVAWGEIDGVLRLRTVSGIWMQHLKNSSRPVTGVAFSKDGALLASGDSIGVIRIWRVKDGSIIQSLYSHSEAITDLVFSPDGQWLVSASQDQTLRLWRFTGEAFLPLPQLIYGGHTGPITSIDFSPNQPLVVSGSEDGTIRLWEIPSS